MRTRRHLPLGWKEFLPHVFINTADSNHNHALDVYLHEIQLLNGIIKYLCIRCSSEHPIAFDTRDEAVAHVRSEHLLGKPFLCTTWSVPISKLERLTTIFHPVIHLSNANRTQSAMSGQ